MLDRIFPKTFDNTCRGHWLAKWLFLGVVLARLAMGINSTVNTRLVAVTADGIPLDKYDPAAANTVVALFGISGFLLLLLALVGILVFVRYRAMIPFMFFLLLVDQLGRRVLLYLHPIAKSGVATADLGFAFVLTILAATIIGFGLSLVRSRHTDVK